MAEKVGGFEVGMRRLQFEDDRTISPSHEVLGLETPHLPVSLEKCVFCAQWERFSNNVSVFPRYCRCYSFPPEHCSRGSTPGCRQKKGMSQYR